MNCPKCNAHNPDSAAFCSLCLTSFAAPPAPAPVVEAAPRPDTGLRAEGLPAEGEGQSAVVRTAEHERFRRTEEGFDWRCDRCGEWTPLEVTTCRVCSLPFRNAVIDESAKPLADVTDTVALGVSLVAPGMGHILRGRVGVGASRLVLFAVFFLGGLVLVAQASQTTSSGIAAVPLLLGALVVWVTTLLDTRTMLAGGERTALPSRAYLWLMIGVFVLTLGAALPTVLRASSQ